MGPINDKTGPGRPVYGVEAKTVERKIRIEPYLDDQLTWICRKLGITRAAGIRQGIRLFIREYSKHHED